MYERCRALAAAGTGSVDEARRWATRPSAARMRRESGGTGSRHSGPAARWPCSRHDPAAAVPDLLPVWEHCQEHGIQDPGVFPVAPDLVEALVETGDLDPAAKVTERLRVLGVRAGPSLGAGDRAAGRGDDAPRQRRDGRARER